ncbi:TPA: hypothetical protein SIA35_004384 [Aeromonas sobria]|nr:hypothetical protein [Aeromonas sobria]
MMVDLGNNAVQCPTTECLENQGRFKMRVCNQSYGIIRQYNFYLVVYSSFWKVDIPVSHYVLILFLLGLVSTYAAATSSSSSSSSFSFQHYDVNSNRLFMHLVTPTTEGDVFLQVGEQKQQLKGAKLIDLFILKVQVPCERLSSGAQIYWAASGRALIEATIPPQVCNVIPESNHTVVPIRIVQDHRGCWIDVGDSTLWRVATELSKLNKATVYQNVYGLFIVNRPHFVGEDINRLKARQLRCPPDELIESISPEDALRLFSEMLEFKTVR